MNCFGDVHLGFRSFDVDVGADEGARFAFLLVARSGSYDSSISDTIVKLRKKLTQKEKWLHGCRFKATRFSLFSCVRFKRCL